MWNVLLWASRSPDLIQTVHAFHLLKEKTDVKRLKTPQRTA